MSIHRPATPTPTMRGLQVLLIGLLAVVAWIIAMLFVMPSTLAYHLDDDNLVVQAELGTWDQGRSFDRHAVLSTEVVTLSGGQRYRGTGLPDFCQGVWGQAGLGEVWQATTCGPQAVVLRVASEPRPVVISPADPGAFIAALDGGDSGSFEAAAAAPDAWPAWWGLLRWGLAAGFVGLLAMLVLSPLVLRYELDGGELAVRTLWGTRRVPLRGAEVRPDPQVKVRLRVFGIGMPGHQVGRYRVEGQTVAVYLSRWDHAVWVRAPGQLPVLVSPADVSGFVSQAQAAI